MKIFSKFVATVLVGTLSMQSGFTCFANTTNIHISSTEKSEVVLQEIQNMVYNNDTMSLENLQRIDTNTIEYCVRYDSGLIANIEQIDNKNGSTTVHINEGDLENTIILKPDGTLLLDGKEVSASSTNDNSIRSESIGTRALSSVAYSDRPFYGTSRSYEKESAGLATKVRVDLQETVSAIGTTAFILVVTAIFPGGAVALSGLAELNGMVTFLTLAKNFYEQSNPNGEAVYIKYVSCDLKNPPDITQGKIYLKIYTRAYYDSRYKDEVPTPPSIVYEKVTIRDV